MKITWWERDDLVEFFLDRPQTFEANTERTLFLRTDQEGDPCVAFRLIPPVKTGPHRMYELQIIPMHWDKPTCDEYAFRCLAGWTSYKLRLQFQRFLKDELKHDDNTAFAASIILAGIANQPERAELVDEGLQPNLYGVPFVPIPVARLPRAMVRYELQGDGYVQISRQGGQLKVLVGLPEFRGQGFGGTLEGHVRPTRPLDLEVICGELFGWTNAPAELEADQLPLKEGV